MAETKYIEAIKAYRKVLEDALEIASDPFKAPEEVVFTSKSVLVATWEMQVEYAAMERASKKKTDG